MVSKPDHYIYCLQETHLKPKDTYRLKVKGWKQAFHANGDQKKVGVAILISDKIDFEIKAMKKDKDWLNGYKNKTPIYFVYKRPTSKQGTHTD